MSRMIALHMARPHERLGISKPRAGRLTNTYSAWNAILLVIVAAMSIGYVIQVNRASARGFVLRDVEQRVEAAHTEVLILEDKAARLSSVESLGTRADALGLVPVEDIQYIHPASKSYALK